MQMIARILARVKAGFSKFMTFIDAHPRTGWYVVGIGCLNVVLNLLDLFAK